MEMKRVFFDDAPLIYTTGAFLKPAKITTDKGKVVWVWYVAEYNEDSYRDGELYNPQEFADTKEELLLSDGEEKIIN